MAKLNKLEREALDTLVAVRDNLAPGHPLQRLAYQDLMSLIGKSIQHLTNKDFGCKSGQHAGPCRCQEEL